MKRSERDALRYALARHRCSWCRTTGVQARAAGEGTCLSCGMAFLVTATFAREDTRSSWSTGRRVVGFRTVARDLVLEPVTGLPETRHARLRRVAPRA